MSKKKSPSVESTTSPTMAGYTRLLGDIDHLIVTIRPFARQLAALQRRMKAAGLFANERELLDCPQCGLREDVLISGLLITYREPGFPQDTGLRFEELTADTFRCPSCGQKVNERFASDEPISGFLAKPATKRCKSAAPAKEGKRKA